MIGSIFVSNNQLFCFDKNLNQQILTYSETEVLSLKNKIARSSPNISNAMLGSQIPLMHPCIIKCTLKNPPQIDKKWCQLQHLASFQNQPPFHRKTAWTTDPCYFINHQPLLRCNQTIPMCTTAKKVKYTLKFRQTVQNVTFFTGYSF